MASEGSALAAGGPPKVTPSGATEGEMSSDIFLGVVKSYNDRRGFGFLACAETADQYGRDVYMPKAEAAQAAVEAATAGLDGEEAKAAAVVAAAAAASAAAAPAPGEKAEKPPPAPRLAEEDLVLFRVRPSIEGYPQAAWVKKLRKVTGVVSRLPAALRNNPLTGEQEAAGDGADGPDVLGLVESEGAEAAHGLRQVPWRMRACGELRLAVGDEVFFCVPNAPEALVDGEEAGEMEAKMISLGTTSRSSGSVLGCFTLDLPRTGAGDIAPHVQLDSHAFGDKLILAGLPADLEEQELMRFFSKQGATQAVVARARTCSFASVSFPGMAEVARFLSRTAHAFADDKETRIARLVPLEPSADRARLPALPAPTLAPGEESGSLLVVWSPLVLAVAYSVELRMAGVDAGATWVTVDVASKQQFGNMANRFDSSCSSCKVAGLLSTAPYQARVSYFTECGTRSEASEASDSCVPTPAQQPSPLEVAGAGVGGGVGLGAGGYGMPQTHPGLLDYAKLFGQQGMPPAPPSWPPWIGSDGLMAPTCGTAPPVHDGLTLPMPPPSYAPGWRSPTGMIVPPPSAPELKPADEHGFAVSVEWPAVVQAAAYVVELREEGSTVFERFVRAAPETKLGTLVELRVAGLRPGTPHGRVYVAQVRTVAADGSESSPSPPGWSPPLPAARASIAATEPPTSGSPLSADAPSFQPGGAVPVSLPPAPPPAPPSAPPSRAPPAWAPPAWLGTAAPGGGSVWGALSTRDSKASGGRDRDVTPWGAPGGPPPPPAGPPPLVQPGPWPEDRPPEAVTGQQECLILD